MDTLKVVPMRVLRNLPLTASVLAVHVGRAGPKAASVFLRRAPSPIRALVSGSAVRRFRPDLSALALAAEAQHAQARAVLVEAISALSRRRSATGAESSGSAEHAGRLAHAAIVLHDVPLARSALAAVGDGSPGAGLSASDPTLALVRSVVAAEQGQIDAAIDALGDATRVPHRRLRARLVGQREVLRADLLSASLGGGLSEVAIAAPDSVASVLHVVSAALPDQQSGYTIRTHGIVSGQRKSGLEASVVTRLGFPVDIGMVSAPTDLIHDGVPYHRLLPRHRIPIPGAARQEVAVAELRKHVDDLQPDLLHAHSKHENAQVALMVGKQTGRPVVYEARGFLEETWVSTGGNPDSDLYRWNRDAETKCMQHAGAVVALSGAMARDIEGRGIDADRVFVVPNSVSAVFAARSGSNQDQQHIREQTRTRLGIPADGTVFGTVSTLNDYEGLDVVIEAMSIDRDPNVWLLIVGDGPARAAWVQRARDTGVAGRVVFTGRVRHAQVRDHLDAMDIFVVPRRRTAVTMLVPPIKPLEAMAVGIPVLASDLPPLAEIVQPGLYGRVAAPESARSWAESMSALRYAPDEVRTFGAQGAAFVAAERTWARAAERYAEIYAITVRH